MSSDGQRGMVLGSMVSQANRLNPFWFTAIMGFVSVVARLPVAATYTIPRELRSQEFFGIEMPAVMMAFVVFPLIETILGQWLPVRVASAAGLGKTGQCVCAALAFSALHLDHWVAVATAFLPGLVFAYTYVVWRHRSRNQAFWVTALTHVWEIGLVVLLRRFLEAA
jgi:hypothetical protein